MALPERDRPVVAGAVLSLTDVTLAAGGTVLAEGIQLAIRPGDKIALIGRNGTGKTTLIDVLRGASDPAEGRRVLRPGTAIGNLPQQAVSGSRETVWDEAAKARAGIEVLRERLHVAERELEANEDGAVERHAAALDTWRDAGGFSEDEVIGSILHGLGFEPATWRRPCAELSGGWQMRVALAKVLLQAPDLALLDEPTNHLDARARSWLADHLAQARHATLVVSHDRHLLRRCATRIAELAHRRLTTFEGGIDAWDVEREARRTHLAAAARRQAGEIARLQTFVDRFGAKATKAAAAHAVERRIARIEPIEAPEADEGAPRLSLPPAPPCDQAALSLLGADIGWPGHPPLLRSADLHLERGMRLALVGPNGAGKSTVLQVLAGRLPPASGRRRVGDRVRIGVFDQDLAATLPGDRTAFEHLVAAAPLSTATRLRGALGALGLSGDTAMRPIASLSGGEKARVALAALTVTPCNVLLLDEPTNPLDLASVGALVEGLASWEGTLVLVSHDRWLIERLATHVARIDGGPLRVDLGVPAGTFATTPRTSQIQVRTAPGDLHRARQREDRKALRRIASLETEIEALERALADHDDALTEAGGDWQLAQTLAAKRAETSTALTAAMEEWERLMSG